MVWFFFRVVCLTCVCFFCLVSASWYVSLAVFTYALIFVFLILLFSRMEVWWFSLFSSSCFLTYTFLLYSFCACFYYFPSTSYVFGVIKFLHSLCTEWLRCSAFCLDLASLNDSLGLFTRTLLTVLFVFLPSSSSYIFERLIIILPSSCLRKSHVASLVSLCLPQYLLAVSSFFSLPLPLRIYLNVLLLFYSSVYANHITSLIGLSPLQYLFAVLFIFPFSSSNFI